MHVNVGNIFAGKLIDKNSPCAVNVHKEAIVACPVEGQHVAPLQGCSPNGKGHKICVVLGPPLQAKPSYVV